MRAKEAKDVAEEARQQADDVEAKVKARNQDIRDLIRQIKVFLTGNPTGHRSVGGARLHAVSGCGLNSHRWYPSRSNIVNFLSSTSGSNFTSFMLV